MPVLQLRDDMSNNDAQKWAVFFTSENCTLQMASHVQLFMCDRYHQELLPRKQNALTCYV